VRNFANWAKKERNNTISRQRIIEIAEREGIDTKPTGDHRWPPFAGALQRWSDKVERRQLAEASTASSDATETVSPWHRFGRLTTVRTDSGPRQCEHTDEGLLNQGVRFHGQAQTDYT
jgi:hypothetical protein